VNSIEFFVFFFEKSKKFRKKCFFEFYKTKTIFLIFLMFFETYPQPDPTKHKPKVPVRSWPERTDAGRTGPDALGSRRGAARPPLGSPKAPVFGRQNRFLVYFVFIADFFSLNDLN
jgi:hypothetical protein